MLFLKNSAIEKFQRVRHQISMKGKPHKEHEKMLYVSALSVNFMLQPHKQIRTNILLSSHNLKLKFMPYILAYTHSQRQPQGRQQSAIRLGHDVSQIRANLQVILRQISMLPTLVARCMHVCVCACVWLSACVCVLCIWAMWRFCLTSSISSSRRQSAGECANCFNGLTTWWAMKSFDSLSLCW